MKHWKNASSTEKLRTAVKEAQERCEQMDQIIKNEGLDMCDVAVFIEVETGKT